MRILGSTTDGETIFAVPAAAMSELSRAMKIIAEFLGGMGAAGSGGDGGVMRDAGCGIRGAEGGGDVGGGEIRKAAVKPAAEKLSADYADGRRSGNGDVARRAATPAAGRKKICAVCGAEFVDTGRTNQRRVCERLECMRKWQKQRKAAWRKGKAVGGVRGCVGVGVGKPAAESRRVTPLPQDHGADLADFAARRIEMIRRATEKANAKTGGI